MCGCFKKAKRFLPKESVNRVEQFKLLELIGEKFIKNWLKENKGAK